MHLSLDLSGANARERRLSRLDLYCRRRAAGLLLLYYVFFFGEYYIKEEDDNARWGSDKGPWQRAPSGARGGGIDAPKTDGRAGSVDGGKGGPGCEKWCKTRRPTIEGKRWWWNADALLLARRIAWRQRQKEGGGGGVGSCGPPFVADVAKMRLNPMTMTDSFVGWSSWAECACERRDEEEKGRNSILSTPTCRTWRRRDNGRSNDQSKPRAELAAAPADQNGGLEKRRRRRRREWTLVPTTRERMCSSCPAAVVSELLDEPASSKSPRRGDTVVVRR